MVAQSKTARAKPCKGELETVATLGGNKKKSAPPKRGAARILKYLCNFYHPTSGVELFNDIFPELRLSRTTFSQSYSGLPLQNSLREFKTQVVC